MTVNVDTRRLDWVDNARAIGIVFVVMGHHHQHGLYNYIYTFHMPLFFFLSGMMFKRKADDRFADFAIKRAKTLLFPYFIFSIALYGLWWFLGRFVDPSVLDGYSLQKNFLGIFYAQGQMEYMRWGLEMWFLPCLYLTSILYYFMAEMSIHKQFAIVVFCALTGFTLPQILSYRLPWSFDVALVALGFFWLGHILMAYIQKYTLSWKSFLFLLMLFGVSVMTYRLQTERIDMYQAIYGEYLLFYLSAIAGVLFYILLSKVLPTPALFAFIGANSLVIYMLHMRALTILNYIFNHFANLRIADNTIIGALTLSMLQIMILVPVVLLINRYFLFLLGRRRFATA